MKKHLIIVISLFGLACKQKPPETFTINVGLQNAPIEEVYLDELELAEIKTVDTARIKDASGEFSFNGIADEEGIYRIRFDNGKMFFLTVKGGDDININGNYTDLSQLNINGSEASAQLNHFTSKINRMNGSLLNNGREYDSLKTSGAGDSLLVVKEQYLQLQQEGLYRTIINFADSTHSGASAVLALSMLQSQDQLVTAKSTFNNLQNRFPHSRIVTSLADDYNKLMNNTGVGSAIAVGDKAPDISYPNPDGKVVSLDSLQGKYVLVDFWASWCAPCRAENPNVVKAYKQYKNNNFTVLGVSLDTKKDNWKKAIKDDGLQWNQVSDLKGWDSQPAAQYGISAIPANFLINPQGKVIATNLRGPALEDTLHKVLQ